MAGIIIHQEKIKNLANLPALCPFGAIEISLEGTAEINSACKLCKTCTRNGPEGVFEYREDAISAAKKVEWQDIAIFGEMSPSGIIHPVALELLGKGRELADKIGQKVSLILIGEKILEQAANYFRHGADRVFVYEGLGLNVFDLERYSAILENYIANYKPSVMLIGETPLGHSLAPLAATQARTGLAADCARLDIQKNGDLDQARSAFCRPQFATVRNKIFSAMMPDPTRKGEIIRCDLPEKLFQSLPPD